MPPTTSLFDEGLTESFHTLSREQKFEFLKGFWPNITLEFFDEPAYESFLQYVGREAGHLRQHQRHFAIQNLGGTIDLLPTLQNARAKPQREMVQEDLSARFLNTDQAAIRRSLELSVRLWLTININSSTVAVGPTYSYETPLDWAPDLSLENLVRNQFVKSPGAKETRTRAKIDPTLTAAYLVNTCGIKLRWTDSLSDHLQFDPAQRRLAVYRHKICLANHLEAHDKCPIPKDGLFEVLDTLNLLFPFGDMATKQLLIKERERPLYSLGSCGRSRQLDLGHYQYFREELEYLIESSNRPRTWKQVAYDRRNKMEWAAFWITVMVALMTIVSIPTNVIQATYTVKAYRVSLQQLKQQ